MLDAIFNFIGNHLLDAIKILCIMLVIGCAVIAAMCYIDWLYSPKDQEPVNEYESSHTPMSELADSFSAFDPKSEGDKHLHMMKNILIHPSLKKQTELLRKMPGEEP